MENLISKKDLLKETGISYGQLYRWKRKNLIPEEWFIKKSTYTGHETFFPKEEIMERINHILDLKEGASLDDLADKFSGSIPEKVLMGREALVSRGIVSREIVALYEEIFQGKTEYNFEDILYMYISEDLLAGGALSIEDMSRVLRLLRENYNGIKENDPSLTMYRKLGVGVTVLHRRDEIFVADQKAIVSNYSIRAAVERLKLKLV